MAATSKAATPKAPVDKKTRLSIDVDVEVGDEIVTKALNFRPLTIVPLGILRRTRRDPQEQMWAIFEWALAPEDLDILDEVASNKLETLLAAMQKASGADLGNLRASQCYRQAWRSLGG